MDPQRWQQVRELFERALELDAGARALFLGEACTDPQLRHEVDSLLAADALTDDSLDEPLLSLREPSQTGRRIGPYELLREIGRGGLGAVYLAVRSDQEFDQEVALKLIQRGMVSEEAIRRFRLERQILAGLEHPNVARLLDGGSTEDGLPYFVMEHVEGQHLDRYCDAHRLTVRRRLELFLEVCSAVELAHRNLVVHRDLKAKNVLVTGDGTPKLIDFGIAKPLDFASTLTASQVHPMTIRSACPEQIRGQQITVACDVYALGLLLFQLLTGESPYPLDTSSLVELGRIICDVEPRRLSAALPDDEAEARVVSRDRGTTPEKLRRRLAGDLDSIVRKALRKEPEKRFSSVGELAGDVRRYLDGRPVVARQGSWTYHAGKLVRRHALAVTVASLLVLAAFGAAAAITLLWRQAVEDRDRAESERRRAERVSEFLVELFQAPDPDRAKGETLDALELLERGKRKILQGLEEEPEIQAELLQTMGRVYRRLGDYGETRALLGEALRLRRATLGGDHPLVAESLHDLAFALQREDEPAAGRELVVEAVAIQRRNAREEPLELARGLTALGSLLYADGKFVEAETALLEALEIKRRSPDATDDELLVTLSNLAATRKMLGRAQEAVDLYREVLEIRRRLHGSVHTRVARSLNSLATVLRDLGEHREAETLLREALEVRGKLYGAEHPEVARSHRVLGTVLHARGDLEGAAAQYREALDLQRRKLRDGHPEIAVTETKLAELSADQGDPSTCESLARGALATLPADAWRRIEAESVLGGCLAAQGRPSEAEPLLVGSYARLREARGEHAPATRAAAKRLAAFREARGRKSG